MSAHEGIAADSVREDSRIRTALLGQPRQSQRNDRAEVPAGLHARGTAGRRAASAGAWRVHGGRTRDLPPLRPTDDLTKELADLRASHSSTPAFEPMITAKTPPPGQDILQASANTFYRGVSLRT